MQIKQWDNGVFEGKAEGNIIIGTDRYPYVTEFCGPWGCSVVIWVGSVKSPSPEMALTEIRRHRDIVRAYWSEGLPTKYWGHSDFEAPPSV